MATLTAVATGLPLAIKGIVALVDRLKGSGNGEKEKKPLAVALAKTLFEGLETPGLGLPKEVTEISRLVQDAWAELNAKGVLKGFDTQLDAVPGMAMDSPLMLLCAASLESQAARLRALAAMEGKK